MLKSMNKIRQFFGQKPWDNIKTRKIMLFLSIGMIVLFTVAIFLFAFLEKVVPDMLIEKYFVFWTFVATSSGAITIAKVMKGKTNSDNDEDDEGVE